MTISTSPVATSKTRPDISHSPGNAGIARSKSNIDGNRRAGIGDRFFLELAFLYLKIVRQHGGVASKPSDAAIGVLKYDDVKLPATSRNLSGNFSDSPE